MELPIERREERINQQPQFVAARISLDYVREILYVRMRSGPPDLKINDGVRAREGIILSCRMYRWRGDAIRLPCTRALGTN